MKGIFILSSLNMHNNGHAITICFKFLASIGSDNADWAKKVEYNLCFAQELRIISYVVLFLHPN